MNYALTSIAEVVGRVLRRTGTKDTSFIPDLNEWVSEAMELLRTSVELSHVYKEVEIRFHKGKYPCGLVELWAVEYCGTRLRYNNGVRNTQASWTPSSTPLIEDAVFVSAVTKENTPYANHLYSSELTKISSLKWHATEWYQPDGRYVNTSFEDGKVTLYYGQAPVDENGFLMIPDEGNYKEAITSYLRARIAGRQEKYQLESLMDQRFELFAGRAVEVITYPSVDKMQATTDTLSRLLPDLNYYQGFFTTIGPETSY